MGMNVLHGTPVISIVITETPSMIYRPRFLRFGIGSPFREVKNVSDILQVPSQCPMRVF
jgi:hypothetical protein